MVMDEVLLLICPSILSLESYTETMFINLGLPISPLSYYGNGKIVQNHVNSVLIINLFFEILCSLSIKFYSACHLACLLLPHLESVNRILNPVTAKNFSQVLCTILDFIGLTISQKIIVIRKLGLCR
uniref:Uncharacterized protein n=1 Tax=Opuntia streptacantha TaxID=393608 RepID=A0A7C9DPQ1_OPUST